MREAAPGRQDGIAVPTRSRPGRLVDRAARDLLILVPIAVPASVCAIYLTSNLWPWAPTVCVFSLVGVSAVCVIARDRDSALFALLCACIFAPSMVGWNTLVPALGAVLLVVANCVYPSWRWVLRPISSKSVWWAVIAVCVGVAAFGPIRSVYGDARPSLAWSMLPGQEQGLGIVVLIVLGASLANAAFEELLWRVGMDRLFIGQASFIARSLALSAMFGLSHIHGTPGGKLGMVFAGLFGLAMSLIRRMAAGSMVPPLVAHFTADVMLIGNAYGLFAA